MNPLALDPVARPDGRPDPPSAWRLIATTAFGLEAVVARELDALGYQTEITRPGWVEFSGDPLAVCRTNLWLRSADRVLLQLLEFSCPDFDALFETVRGYAWEEWLPADASILVTARSHQSQLTSVPACQRTVKKGIVERLGPAYGLTTLPESGDTFGIRLILSDDRAVLALDTSGAGLHQRGYRDSTRQAHVKETLAAALVQLSFWQPDRPLIDPFCGSGTILIEAAWIARKMAPGRLRTFAAEHWPRIPAAVWSAARNEAKEQQLEPFDIRWLGFEMSYHALRDARESAHLAGVASDIHFQQLPFTSIRSPRDFGCIITRIPEAARLAASPPTASPAPRRNVSNRPGRAEAPLRPPLDPHDEIVRQIPIVLRKLPTWSYFLLSTHAQFERLIEKSADRRRKLYNGKSVCTYFQYHGPPPNAVKSSDLSQAPILQTPDLPAVVEPSDVPGGGPPRQPRPQLPPARPKSELIPVFGKLPPKADEQAEQFANRLRKLARHLRRWPRNGITCYRLYERDIPEIPLVVDRYENHLHLVEFERPHDRDRAQHAAWLDLMTKTAAETLEIPLPQVFLKRRLRQKGNLQHDRVDERGYEIEVQEGGLKFLVNLSDYTDTGLFLDHRQTRAMVRADAAGKSVLNLFCYTGAFSVYAAAGGALRTVSVDKSSHYLAWYQRNLQLNGLQGAAHVSIASDIHRYLESLPAIPQFDLAVVDPPTFSNSKSEREDWIVQRDHIALLQAVQRRIRPGGRIYFSTNFRTFRWELPPSDGWSVREISRQTVPADYRNQRIHRCWKLTRTAGPETGCD